MDSINVPGVSNSDKAIRPQDSDRPEFILEGNEDRLYHDLRLKEQGNEPEFVILEKSWAFNRAMRWLRPAEGTILCHGVGESLRLTGENRISEWFSDPANGIAHGKSAAMFKKKSARKRDCMVLPGLQFHRDQHPEIAISVHRADAEWQCCLLIKGRCGQPLLSTGWKKGTGREVLNIADALRANGFSWNYPEIHVAIGTWTPDRGHAEIEFSITLPTKAVLIGALPVSRTMETATADGVPVSAVILDEHGAPKSPAGHSLFALTPGGKTPLAFSDGVWTGSLRGLDVGGHRVRLVTEGAARRETFVDVHVCKGDFVSYSKELHSPVVAGRPTGPLSGSYQGMVFFENAGTPGERLVQGKRAEELESASPTGLRWHYWEALKESEVVARVAFLAKCGYDILHLSQGWGLWEKLDAGGRIAPHGAEQLALFLRTAAANNLKLILALSHYPYGTHFTPAHSAYLEAGFKDEDWNMPESGFTKLFHGYLGDVARLWNEDDAIAAFSASGEGDHTAGPERCNDTMDFMRRHSPRHLFYAEAIGCLEKLPRRYSEAWIPPFIDSIPWMKDRTATAWRQPLFGSRMYWIGNHFHPDADQSVEFKFLAMGDYFMSEGSWPCPKLYANFKGIPATWSATARYRRRLRDSLYLGLIHRSPFVLSWEEQFVEDEHAILQEVAGRMDWNQAFQRPLVAISVDDRNTGSHFRNNGPHATTSPFRETLIQYEEFLAAFPIMSRYVEQGYAPAPGELVIDASLPFATPTLPDRLLAELPLRLQPTGYRVSYLLTEDGRTLVAYIYNATGHKVYEAQDAVLCGQWHREPGPAKLSLHLNRPVGAESEIRFYDLDEQRQIHMETGGRSLSIEREPGIHDYLLVVTPK